MGAAGDGEAEPGGTGITLGETEADTEGEILPGDGLTHGETEGEALPREGLTEGLIDADGD